eukprot:g2411.t1
MSVPLPISLTKHLVSPLLTTQGSAGKEEKRGHQELINGNRIFSHKGQGDRNQIPQSPLHLPKPTIATMQRQHITPTPMRMKEIMPEPLILSVDEEIKPTEPKKRIDSQLTHIDSKHITSQLTHNDSGTKHLDSSTKDNDSPTKSNEVINKVRHHEQQLTKRHKYAIKITINLASQIYHQHHPYNQQLSLDLYLKPWTTVLTVKQKLHGILNIPIAVQRLFLRGRELRNHSWRLSPFIDNDAQIMLVISEVHGRHFTGTGTNVIIDKEGCSGHIHRSHVQKNSNAATLRNNNPSSLYSSSHRYRGRTNAAVTRGYLDVFAHVPTYGQRFAFAIESARRGLYNGRKPQLALEGMGGTYFLHHGIMSNDVVDDYHGISDYHHHGTGSDYHHHGISEYHQLRSKYAAVFKPADEEPGGINNPRGLVGPLGELAAERGIHAGSACYREVAAFLIDHEANERAGTVYLKLGVPPTVLAELTHPGLSFIANGSTTRTAAKNILGNNRSHHAKLGALQEFIQSTWTGTDFPRSLRGTLSVETVQKLAIFDIRMLNTDRNEGNLLIVENDNSNPFSSPAKNNYIDEEENNNQKEDKTKYRYNGYFPGHDDKNHQGNLSVIPIDHAYTLPNNLNVAWCDWVWFDWKQVKKPLSKKLRDEISKIDPFADAAILRRELTYSPHGGGGGGDIYGGGGDIMNGGTRLTTKTGKDNNKRAVVAGNDIIGDVVEGGGHLDERALENFICSSLLLKHGAKKGLSLHDIASLIARKELEKPSKLEIAMKTAKALSLGMVKHAKLSKGLALKRVASYSIMNDAQRMNLFGGSDSKRSSTSSGNSMNSKSSFSMNSISSSRKSNSGSNNSVKTNLLLDQHDRFHSTPPSGILEQQQQSIPEKWTKKIGKMRGGSLMRLQSTPTSLGQGRKSNLTLYEEGQRDEEKYKNRHRQQRSGTVDTLLCWEDDDGTTALATTGKEKKEILTNKSAPQHLNEQQHVPLSRFGGLSEEQELFFYWCDRILEDLIRHQAAISRNHRTEDTSIPSSKDMRDSSKGIRDRSKDIMDSSRDTTVLTEVAQGHTKTTTKIDHNQQINDSTPQSKAKISFNNKMDNFQYHQSTTSSSNSGGTTSTSTTDTEEEDECFQCESGDSSDESTISSGESVIDHDGNLRGIKSNEKTNHLETTTFRKERHLPLSNSWSSTQSSGLSSGTSIPLQGRFWSTKKSWADQVEEEEEEDG